MRLTRLPVIGDDDRLVVFELKSENPRGCGIDQPQANPLPASNRETIGNTAIDRHGVTDAARHASFHRVVEPSSDRAVLLEAEVAEHPDDVTVYGWRLKLLDDERSGEAAAYLFCAVRMWVVPIGSRVRRRKFVDKIATRLDRRLVDIRCPVHGVWDTDAMPMDRGVLGQAVLDRDPHSLALGHTEFRTGNHAV